MEQGDAGQEVGQGAQGGRQDGETETPIGEKDTVACGFCYSVGGGNIQTRIE